MPILNVDQIKRFTSMCGATIPDKLLGELETIKDDAEAVLAKGVEHATQQCRELLDKGAPGIHFYTLNRSDATRRILQTLYDEGYGK
ncbi:MAG: methylenetetrahydrofolate reductase, partial [Chrysiogenetes bacterium]|nr:methylenetetrahydrofolate reductase [Chrysiogenetes bacterium]